MIRCIGWVAVVLALTGLFFVGCDWKKKEMVLACQCMVDCADQIEVDTPEEMMKCQKMCKGKHYEGWDQGSQWAIQVLAGDRNDCSL